MQQVLAGQARCGMYLAADVLLFCSFGHFKEFRTIDSQEHIPTVRV